MSNYSAALHNLTDETWRRLETGEKMAILQAIENETAVRENRQPCVLVPEYIPSSEEEGITMGYYSRGTRLITINTEQLAPPGKYSNDYREMVDTVLHEGRHAYQHQAVLGEIEHDDKEELAAWAENMKPGHYISYERNPRGYYNQPIERDARSFAEERLRIVETEKALLFPGCRQEQELSVAGIVQSGKMSHEEEFKSVEELLEERRKALQEKGVLDRSAIEATIERERIELQHGRDVDIKEIGSLRESERLQIEDQIGRPESVSDALHDARTEIERQMQGEDLSSDTEMDRGADRNSGQDRDSGVSY